MSELTGSLIQMNAKMVVPNAAIWEMAIGLVGFFSFVILTAIAAKRKKKVVAIVLAIFALCEMAMFVDGAVTPRDKIVHACVNGPISLEGVAARYDIIKVDGKELTLRVR